ncbi:MAG: hypothetical protein ACJA0V_003949, partial [Planctomycetota bacterium]
ETTSMISCRTSRQRHRGPESPTVTSILITNSQGISSLEQRLEKLRSKLGKRMT